MTPRTGDGHGLLRPLSAIVRPDLARFLQGCPDPLCQAYDVALLDLDGVVYLGDAAVPGAPRRWTRRRTRACGWRT